MQWSFSNAATRPLSPSQGPTLKRPPSGSNLQSLAAKHQRLSVCAAAGQQQAGSGGGSGSGSGGGGSGVAQLQGLPDVDVQSVAAKHGWDLEQRQDYSADKHVRWLRVNEIRRPLQGTRSNDQEKVAALMRSIEEIGLQEPIDVLEVEGRYYGFSGCHRFEAHQRLGKEMILCRVRKATPQVLKMHMM